MTNEDDLYAAMISVAERKNVRGDTLKKGGLVPRSQLGYR